MIFWGFWYVLCCLAAYGWMYASLKAYLMAESPMPWDANDRREATMTCGALSALGPVSLVGAFIICGFRDGWEVEW
jgi:hypothetical protein